MLRTWICFFLSFGWDWGRLYSWGSINWPVYNLWIMRNLLFFSWFCLYHNIIFPFSSGLLSSVNLIFPFGLNPLKYVLEEFLRGDFASGLRIHLFEQPSHNWQGLADRYLIGSFLRKWVFSGDKFVEHRAEVPGICSRLLGC